MSTRDHTLNALMAFVMFLAGVFIIICTQATPEAERAPGYVVAVICIFIGICCAHDNFAVAVREEEDRHE